MDQDQDSTEEVKQTLEQTLDEEFHLALVIDKHQLEVIRRIHKAIESVRIDFKEFPISFRKLIDNEMESIMDNLEAIDFHWKKWVLEGFERDLSKHEFMQSIKIQPRKSRWWGDQE
jgi:hypothetical protein